MNGSPSSHWSVPTQLGLGSPGQVCHLPWKPGDGGARARNEGEDGRIKGTLGQAVRAQITLPSPSPSAPRDLETGGPLWAAGLGLTEDLVPAAQQIPARAEVALESGEDRGQVR